MRRILLTSIIAIVAFSTAQIVAQPPQPPSAFDKELIDQEKQLLHEAETKNKNAVEHTIAEDFKGIGENGDFYDRGEVVESASNGMPAGTRAYEFEVVKLNDASAVVTYNIIVPEDHPRYRHMSDTWAKVGGQWKLKFRQITPNLWSENDTD